MARRGQRRVTAVPSPVQDQPPPAPPRDRRAYLRLRIKAAHKRVFCTPEQWRCGRCGTGMVRQQPGSVVVVYAHMCTREPAADIVNRIRTGMIGD